MTFLFSISRRLRSRKHVRLLLGVAALATLGAITFVLWPLPDGLLERRSVVSVRFTDRLGGTLRELRSREDGRSIPLPGGRVPPLVRAAFLSAEDKRFEDHPGVDLRAIGRAIGQNLRAVRVVSGASTITQQLARRIRPHARTLPGKAYEALWAFRLTAHLPRERILVEYLDRVPLGNSTFGVEAASELYFGRSAAQLSAGQAALLAGMTRSPARYDPYRHRDRSLERMRQVLALMEANGYIGAEERRVASDAPLDLIPPSRAFEAPHLIAHLAGALPAMGLDEAVRLETTLDPSLQLDVEAAVKQVVDELADRRVGQAAAIVVDNRTGEVLAYVGSADFLDEASSGQIDGIRALRQPGSALKPFAYGLALAMGRTPAQVLSDVETHLATPSGDYVPKNYDRRVHGPVRLRAALANSYNVPAVRLAEELGIERVLGVLRRAGFESLNREPSHYGVGVVLGNGDVTLRESARAFRGLAMGGLVGPLTEVRRAWDATGRPLPLAKELEPRRFLPDDAVALLTDIMADEQARAPAFGLDNSLRLAFPVAVKTGTSRAYVDNWTIGFTRERTVGVWVGNFDGTPMRGVSGITGAGPLFAKVMTRAMHGLEPAPLVDRGRFEKADICALSGDLSGAACPGVLHEVFLPGSRPTRECSMHRLAPVNTRTGAPAPCGEAGTRMRTVLDVGPQFYTWARGEGLVAGPWPAQPCIEPGEGGETTVAAGGTTAGPVPDAAVGATTAGSPPDVALGGTSVAAFPGVPAGGSTVAAFPGVPAGGTVAPASPGAAVNATSAGAPRVFPGAPDTLAHAARTAGSGPRLVVPGDGDEYLLDPGIPLEAQTIPVRALAPPGVSRLEVRTSAGDVKALSAPFATRVPARRGRQRLELWVPGAKTPAAVAWYWVR